MPALVLPEEPIAMDRNHSPPFDLDLVSPGDEFAWDFAPLGIDVSDLECHPLLASDLPLNSELLSMQSTAHL
jgi:hypothetical protein